jgi:hypothetical protein
MRNRFTKFLLILGLIVIVAAIGIFIGLYGPLPPAPPPLPTPNGYTAFVQAKQLLQPETFDFSAMNPEQLQALVRSNANALQLVRSNLDEKNQVPLGFSTSFSEQHIKDLADLKAVATAFSAEGRLAEIERRPADAANSYADIILLGIKAPHGGLIIDALVGLAIEGIGTAHLQKIVNQLDVNASHDLALKLEAANSERQPWQQVLQQEHYWSRKSFPGFQNRLAAIFTYRSFRQMEARGGQKFKSHQLETVKLSIALAAHAFELETGHRPKSAADLVPLYLRAIPQNPVTGANITNVP